MTDPSAAETVAVEAVLGLGSNMGDLRFQLDCAVAALHATPGVSVTRRSAYYKTAPWGVTDQPFFVNMCVAVATTLTPRDLLAAALAIEQKTGRVRRERWGPRVLDIDILTYGDLSIDEPGLHLPHPHMLERAFVLAPLADLGPERVVAGVRVADALAALGTAGVERLDWAPAV
ncbi:2-amino-4-hydroxy-6-hydroxymethyldihydropteridine diphosphokinase [Chelatococcus sp. SYSU_G07232]|uniref:2-amino-4-hydroxy-6-hydroxymethyldihydropteridine pyrophosphokinase n=1 Tax=Chelatococcus albus TaxID=3047466 RepID=A0ABT7AJ64_9HYPH|nr:2-amino-4-hydroxy-6-hydroxymethyldihydropteridine diphosphokinase [Chelatococcus sp. SYSU_G07232]MDJ1159421.1 2-amino-4-hydroxy-6-hydroxymethyldihydropteridine diphosphokinase [Chelatococcus sp. SYSU_G07232]